MNSNPIMKNGLDQSNAG